ncbi:MAG: isocitrate lyase/phosphoenolpyruvate mutase family protein [Muribaculum sp.]|nr:isocitrate lyase/phosphoenolpyruvate mutase family protein [Muribaculum sp.]
MKALILNSGMGCRMGVLTSEHPKCMTEISGTETILSRQLKMLAEAGVTEVVMTTGMFDGVLMNYCRSLELPTRVTFVKNPLYKETNYIYSIYCAREFLEDDIILMHGDLVFEYAVLEAVLASRESCMTVSSSLPLPEKDFKAVVRDGRITKVGIEFFNEAVAAQPLYLLKKRDWLVWLARIVEFCEGGSTKCYAENAFNEVSGECRVVPLDVRGALCSEVDNPEDLAVVSAGLREVENRTVYMSFATDVVHSGHIKIIRKAGHLGRLIVGILSDEAVASYKRFPMVPFSERKAMFESIAGIHRVVEQDTLSYADNLRKYRPTYVVHGDDWLSGFQRPVRDEVVSVLASYGGQLVEYPYSQDEKYEELESRMRAGLSLPDVRRARLRRILSSGRVVTAMEAHSGLTGLIVEKAAVQKGGAVNRFDAIWISSLCDSVMRGKAGEVPVDMTSRMRTVDDIMDVTTKPVIFDAASGGRAEEFIRTVKMLERKGVSMIVAAEGREGTAGGSAGAEPAGDFCGKLSLGKKAQKSKDLMLCAQVKGVTPGKGVEEALRRAFAYVGAGADAVMLEDHGPDSETLLEFMDRFRQRDGRTPLCVQRFSLAAGEKELRGHGANLIVYADQLARAGVPVMQRVADIILENEEMGECDGICMPMEDMVALVPEDD